MRYNEARRLAIQSLLDSGISQREIAEATKSSNIQAMIDVMIEQNLKASPNGEQEDGKVQRA